MISGFNGSYRFLSNFYPSPINFEGRDYPSVEHAYQAAKTEDDALRATIVGLSAGEAKRAGRGLKLRADWDDVKLTIMLTLLRKKFRDPMLAAALLQTGDSELEEGNYWHDNFWGNCTCVRCGPDGENHLGKTLMKVRTELHPATQTEAAP